ncbi:uracil-DNA glycosylase [Sphingobium lignivorans]|uniref:Uracil-DNA glycosylase n=1 Tax=Sphingobium lignivorans TaxID=2735886 RepID=A0ABR6NAI0_9SPHN|nr:uracil-DNA glycosylase [Sphingobium lignivorans]MBB5984274.1 uracil-DNA glycosylase [Sphingobium lignivorans]
MNAPVDPPTVPASLDESWRAALGNEFAAPYMADLKRFLLERKQAGAQIFPRGQDWFNALALTPLDKVRAVILGQDPYHGPGQAHGLCFSVRPGVRPPPSLVNIFKELRADIGFTPPGHGHLDHWARQGVLLLNSVLTVEMGRAGAHAGRGWERFTDAVIARVAALEQPVAFLLWGAHAQKKAGFVEDVARGGRHLVLRAPHPSPLSAHNGFFGCRHFSQANAFLEAHGRGKIDWTLPDAH